MTKLPTILLGIVCVIAGLGILLILFLMITEYRPDEAEHLEMDNAQESCIQTGTDIQLMTWNIGYAGLGKDADFFMDGGKQIRAESKERVSDNLSNIIKDIKEQEADIYLIQEIDKPSYRTFKTDEYNEMQTALKGYSSCYATTFKCAFVPYPLPPIGQVDSGIATFSRHKITDNTRFRLPTSFKWPVKMANLKRCLLESRFTVEGTNRELVIFNLHLEAFDSGEGKIAQTNYLKERMETERQKGNYVIAGGDFNQIFSNIDENAYPVTQPDNWQPGRIDIEEFNGQYAFFMDTSAPTCRSTAEPYNADNKDFQYFMLDGFVVSNNITVSSVQTRDNGFIYSDHNPVVLQFQLNEDP